MNNQERRIEEDRSLISKADTFVEAAMVTFYMEVAKITELNLDRRPILQDFCTEDLLRLKGLLESGRREVGDPDQSMSEESLRDSLIARIDYLLNFTESSEILPSVEPNEEQA